MINFLKQDPLGLAIYGLALSVALGVGCLCKKPPLCVSSKPARCQHADPSQLEFWEDEQFAKHCDEERDPDCVFAQFTPAVE